MKTSLRLITKSFVIAAIGMYAVASSQAAVLKVPSAEFGNLYDAIPAAADGDEIHVANDYNESLGWITLDGKDISIISYTPDFSAPATGAQWKTLVAGGVDNALLTVSNGSVTMKGFDLLTEDGNVFFLNSGANLILDDCTVTSVTKTDTAGIKVPSDAEDVHVTINNCRFDNNGRGVWFNSVIGTTSLTITNSEFSGNRSYPVEWRVKRGTHTFNASDNEFSIVNNRQIRLLAFNTGSGDLTTVHSNFNRCRFISTSLPGVAAGRSPLKVGGVPDSADTNSTMTVAVTNCTFDLLNGADDLETVALDTQDDIATRKFAATFDHCTIVFGGSNQCGFRLRENLSTIIVSNSIVDGNNEGRIALRGWRGTIVSNKNLLSAATLTQTSSGGSVVLSGTEITDQSADFVDRFGGDFQLTADSPALFAGDDLGITEDILGNPRPAPVATNPDLGAYEMNIAAAVSDWAMY